MPTRRRPEESSSPRRATSTRGSRPRFQEEGQEETNERQIPNRASRRPEPTSSRGSRRGAASSSDSPISTKANKTSPPKQEPSLEEQEEGLESVSGSGWAYLNKKHEQIEKEKERRAQTPRDFYMTDGEYAEVQMLDKEPFIFEAHSIMTGGSFQKEPCQKSFQRNCLMCNEGIKSTTAVAFKLIDYRGNYDKAKEDHKWDEPIEKIWVTGMTLAKQIHTFIKKKGVALDEIVLGITRSGSGKETSYNIEMAMDKNNVVYEPIEFEPKKDATADVYAAKSNEELADMGFSEAKY